ncbi:MAG: hypothetical protein R3B70_44075 [Polyangiaceae bacterium]
MELIARLLDVFIAFTAEPMIHAGEGGLRGNLDPTGGFKRSRSGALSLRDALTSWDGSLPAPPGVRDAAREMVTAYGHPNAGQWETHTVPEDAWEQLLWPDSAGDMPARSR